MLLYLLLLMGCAKKSMVQMARSAFTNQNCVKTLETYMRSAGCSNIQVQQRQHELVLRCQKPDNERKNIWESHWFRISPSFLNIAQEQKAEIESHTICKDEMHRLEAYPPE